MTGYQQCQAPRPNPTNAARCHPWCQEGLRTELITPNPKFKLLDQVREVIRLKHYSIRTETCSHFSTDQCPPRAPASRAHSRRFALKSDQGGPAAPIPLLGGVRGGFSAPIVLVVVLVLGLILACRAVAPSEGGSTLAPFAHFRGEIHPRKKNSKNFAPCPSLDTFCQL